MTNLQICLHGAALARASVRHSFQNEMFRFRP